MVVRLVGRQVGRQAGRESQLSKQFMSFQTAAQSTFWRRDAARRGGDFDQQVVRRLLCVYKVDNEKAEAAA